MPEHEYINLAVPEHLYLAVCGFMGNGKPQPMTVADVPDDLVAEIVMQAQPIPDHEIDRLGEQVASLLADLAKAGAELQRVEAQNNQQAQRIRQLEAERQLLQDANENIGRQYDEARDEIERLRAALPATVELGPTQELRDKLAREEEETAAPEESTEAAAPAPSEPEPVAPAAQATPTEQTFTPSGKPRPLPGMGWKESVEARKGVPGAWKKPETVAQEEAAARFVAECVVKGDEGDMIPNPELRDAYQAWREKNNAPEVKDNILGKAMTDAKKFTRKQQKAYDPKRPNFKPMCYMGVRLADAVAPALDPKERQRRDVEEVRRLAKTLSKGREIVVEDDKAPAPYIAPKPKPGPTKQPILAVKNADQRPHLSDYSSVRVIQSNGVVTTVDAMDWIDPDEDTEPIRPEDADARTFDLWTDVKAGMRSRPLGYLPDVLALEGVNTDELEQAVKHPTDVEIRPETKSKGYPVLGFRRGDVKVIVGFRDQQKPAVIAAYWDPLLTPDRHVVYRHGGGGAKKQSGLPTTVKQSVTQLRRRGFTIPDTWEKSTKPVQVEYDGQQIGKMTVHLANKSQVQGDYQRLLRQAHAIDRRKGLVSA